MLCQWIKLNNCTVRQRKGSLQTKNHIVSPAHVDTAKGRVSSCISFQTGSFTVEAALIVPFFFIAMIILISLIDMIRIQSSITLSLNESSKRLGMYAYAAGEVSDEIPVQTVETGACIAYAQAQLPTFDRVKVSLLRSSYKDHVVDLAAKVTYEFPVKLAGIRQGVFYCRARVHAWTGYRAEEDGRYLSAEEMVYITDRQTVYHSFGDCTHLQLSIQSGNVAQVKKEHYTACSYCKPKGTGSCYYTLYGDCYHSDARCQALKRTGSLVPISSVSELKECSRCEERENHDQRVIGVRIFKC